MAITLSAIKHASRLLLTRESFNFVVFPTRHSLSNCGCYSTLNKGPYIYEDISVKLISNYGDGEGSVVIKPFFKDLQSTGLQFNDPRLSKAIERLKLTLNSGTKIKQTEFVEIIQDSAALIEKALKGKFVIENFESFSSIIREIYEECINTSDGKNASYIPELARIDPSLWAVSLCTTSGQRYSIGNFNSLFTLQSGGKCFNYAIGLDEVGRDEVHKYIGMEPSGGHFNKVTLNAEDKPHNPMINTGAMVLCSLIKPRLLLHERMDFMLNRFSEVAGLPKRSVKCDMITCDSEMDSAYKNLALLNYIKSKDSFPPNTSLDKTIKLYTRLCSVEMDCERASVMAATLANGGICPLTEEKVLSADSVRHTLTLMHSCGMYDYSGEFAFNVGLPAKSGVSGVIFLVIPNVMGLCMYSPPVNKNGNSVRGLQFCRRLIETFNFHMYDSLIVKSNKMDPRKYRRTHKELEITSIMYGAKTGALSSMQRYFMSGTDLKQCDYDNRTPLHVAATNGHLEVVKFLLEKAEVPLNPMDIWSQTPLDNAIQFGHHHVAEYLKSKEAIRGSKHQ